MFADNTFNYHYHKVNKKLSILLNSVKTLNCVGSTDMTIVSLCFDSRKAEKGSLFFAVKGSASDGHLYIEDVIKKGAVAIVCEEMPKTLNDKITYIQVKNSNEALGFCASEFYGNPSRELQLVGITGTNGKTTTVTLLHRLFRELGHHTGLLSTIQNKIDETVIPSTHTTPDAVQLNALLRQMVDAGCEYCFMEVSSHAVDQHRISGLSFAGAIFSNITHDHLDYHKTFDAYIKAKKAFFDGLSAQAFALTNADDKNGLVMTQNTSAKIKTYSLRTMADFKTKVIENSLTGLHLIIDNKEVWCRLVGSFNAYNFTAIYGTAVLLGQDPQMVLQILSSLESAEGRFEIIESPNHITGIVDYAHTPDALDNVLSTIENVRNGNETLITVVGCGGDRDAGKRPVMAQIACKKSNKVILTSDNPRSEDPYEILKQMEAGLDPSERRKALIIENREEAIRTACMLAQAGDIILVAGKGHEKYQEIKGVKHPFDDKEVLRKFLN